MKCPSCKENFHPQMNNHFIGMNSKKKYVFVYFQMCPACKNPVLGTKESDKGFLLNSETDDIQLLQ